jgi:hypothetical protein
MASKIGWILAAVLVLGLAAVITLMLVFPSPSKPTPATRAEGFMALKTADIDLKPLLGFEPNQPGNAADDYHRAVELAEANQERVKAAMEAADTVEQPMDPDAAEPDIAPLLDAETVELLKALNRHLAAGAQKAHMQYTFVHTPKAFEVGFFVPQARKLQNVADALRALYHLHRQREAFSRAEAVAENLFMLGRHMDRERIRVNMVVAGLDLQQMALGYLGAVWAEDPNANRDKLRRIDRAGRALDRVFEAYRMKRNAVWQNPPNPGDVYKVLEEDEDRAWRVQALLMLGVIRFTHAKFRGDTRVTRKLIEEYLHSDDPYLAAAAKAAHEFTEKDFKVVGSK